MRPPLRTASQVASFLSLVPALERKEARRELLGGRSLERDYVTLADSLRPDIWLEDVMRESLEKKTPVISFQGGVPAPDDTEAATTQVEALRPGVPSLTIPVPGAGLGDTDRCLGSADPGHWLAGIQDWREVLALQEIMDAAPRSALSRLSTAPSSLPETARVGLVRASRGIASDLLAALDAAHGRLAYPMPSEAWVAPGGGFTAWADLVRDRAGRPVVRLCAGSALVNSLGVNELTFLAGRELAAAWCLVTGAAARPLSMAGSLYPAISGIRQDRWRRFVDVGADRAGLLACGDLRSAAVATLVAATGLSPDAFVGGVDDIINAASSVPHDNAPPPPCETLPPGARLSMLREFERAGASRRGQGLLPSSLTDQNASILAGLARQPESGSAWEALMEFVAVGGLKVLGADWDAKASEVSRLIELLYTHFTDRPEDEIPVPESLEELDALLKRATDRVLGETSPEQKRLAIMLLASIAKADHSISGSEKAVLSDIANSIGVDQA